MSCISQQECRGIYEFAAGMRDIREYRKNMVLRKDEKYDFGNYRCDYWICTAG